jgi:hypothetical protein
VGILILIEPTHSERFIAQHQRHYADLAGNAGRLNEFPLIPYR